jgi:hypothetical protein
MREYAEFRVDEKYAHVLFADDEGERLGASVRKITLDTRDPRYERIGELQKRLRRQGKSFFTGWSLKYQYSAAELKAAHLLQLKITTSFRPTGEECGTRYNDEAGCPICGAGAPQITPLFVREQRMPKTRDFCQSWGGEVIVSRRVKELFARHGMTGARFEIVRPKKRLNAGSADWFQFFPENSTAEIVPPTQTGDTLFDDGGDPFAKRDTSWMDKLPSGIRQGIKEQFERMEEEIYHCPFGDSVGLHLLSEVTIKASTKPNLDIVATRQFIGCRRGLFRQKRLLLITQRLYRLLVAEKIKGFKVHVAHLA